MADNADMREVTHYTVLGGRGPLDAWFVAPNIPLQHPEFIVLGHFITSDEAEAKAEQLNLAMTSPAVAQAGVA